MVFSTNTILSARNKTIGNKIEINDIDSRSFFIESLNMILEEERITKAMIAESSIYINEGLVSSGIRSLLDKLDPVRLISRILTGFMNLLEKLWNNFYSFLLNFLGANNVIKAYKSKLETINFNVDFYEERYIYTNLGTSASYTTFNNELSKEYTNLVLRLSTLRDFKSIDVLLRELDSIRNDISDTDNYLDNVRGNIVGIRDTVTKEDFPEALFKFFRNGGDKLPNTAVITPTEIKSSVDKYFNYNKDLKQIQKDKKDLIDSAKKLEKNIKSINLQSYVKDNLTQEAQNIFVSLLQNKANRVKDLCTIYTQVFSVKLDVVKESYSQHAKILFTACKALAKEGL